MNRVGVLIVAACALLLGMPVVRARDENLSLEMSTGLASRYVYRGIERSAENWQTSFEGIVAGWRGRFWLERPFSSNAPGELQSMLGYSWPVANQWLVEVKGTHFWYVDAPVEGAAGHSFEGAVVLSLNTRSHWRPAVEFAYDIRYHSRAIEVSLARDITFKASGAVLEFRAYGGQVAAEYVLPDSKERSTSDEYSYFGAGIYLRHRLGLHWEMTEEASLAGTANQAESWSPVGGRSGTRGWVAVGTSYRF